MDLIFSLLTSLSRSVLLFQFSILFEYFPCHYFDLIMHSFMKVRSLICMDEWSEIKEEKYHYAAKRMQTAA